MSGPNEERDGKEKAGATALSSTQGTSVGRAFALGPNGNRFLNEELTADERPTPQDRVLEIALLWGDTVIDVRTYKAGTNIRIGPGLDAQFRLYDESVGEGFDLVTSKGAEFAIHSPPGARDRKSVV